MSAESNSEWTTEEAVNLYMIDRWGAGYFGVNPAGKMTVSPMQDQGGSIPIIDVEGRLVGIVSHTDIVRLVEQAEASEAEEDTGRA